MKAKAWAVRRAWQVLKKLYGADAGQLRAVARLEDVAAVEVIAQALDGAYCAGAEDAAK